MILSLAISCNLLVNSICFGLDPDFDLQDDGGWGKGRSIGGSIGSICADLFNLFDSTFAPALSRFKVLSRRRE